MGKFFSKFKNILSNFRYREKIIYIINNYPSKFKNERVKRLELLINISFPKIQCKVIHFTEVESYNLKKSEGIILTGSSYNVSTFKTRSQLREKFEPVVDLIRDEHKKPILGICFGHQLIAYAFGATIHRMNYKAINNDILDIGFTSMDQIVPFSQIKANLNHMDYVSPQDEYVAKEFDILATLQIEDFSTIQYMHHKKRDIYSMQFHPENHIVNYTYPPHITDEEIDEAKIYGQKIIENFIRICLS